MREQNVRNPFSTIPVHVYESVGSTMDVARETYRRHPASGIVIVARHQEAGRGRVCSRTWFDTPGESLLMTLVLELHDIHFPLQQLPLRTGLGVAEFLQKEGGLPASIKWPNDILVHGKKICGILCESTNGAAYIGIGMNSGQRAFPLRSEWDGRFKRMPTSLFLEGVHVTDPLELLEGVLMYLRGAFTEVEWKTRIEERLYLLNETVAFLPGAVYEHQSIDAEPDFIQGKLTGIDDHGGIVIQQDREGEESVWYSGELIGVEEKKGVVK